MSWCASWEKINSRGDVYSGLESTPICNYALDDLPNLFEFQSNELGKLFQSPYLNVDGIKENYSALRFVSSKRLCIHHGQRIFTIRRLLYIFKQEVITLRDYKSGIIFINP